METQTPLPRWLQRWPEERRRLFAWVGLALTVLIGIPAAVVGGIFLFGVDQCGPVNSGNSMACSPIGRTVAGLAMIAVLLPLVLKWARFLQRLIKYRDEDAYRK